MNSQTTIFICNCCGKVARSRQQPILNPARKPLTQVECMTAGCVNFEWTYTYREGDADNAQVLDRYTPVQMDQAQAERFAAAIEFKVKG